MKNHRFAYKILITLIRDQWHYRGRLVLDIVLMFARCGVLLMLYSYVFRLKGGEINGSNFSVVAWSIFLYFALSTLRLRDITRAIMHDVRSGTVETIFTKPVSYVLYRMIWQLGSGISSFVVISICGATALAFWVGIPHAMTIGIFIPTLAAVSLGGIVLTLLIYAIIGFLAFWIEDVDPVFWLVDKTIMVLGGSYLPIALFPPFLLKAAIWSPFGASMFVTHTVGNAWKMEWGMFAGIQLMWICICGGLLWILNKYAHERVSINGG